MNKLANQKNKLNDVPVFVDVVKLKGNMLMPTKVKKKVAADNKGEKNVNGGKKVVEKLVPSKKAKQVKVETELVPVDNDAPVSANEEESKTINDASNKVIKKVAGGNKRKKDLNEEADFPSIGFEDIESLKGGRRNLFDEKSTVQNLNEDDMILQDSLLNLLFLSTQEVSCLEIDTQKSPQIQKQGIPKSFHRKLKLPEYVSPDGQAIVEKRQEDTLTETTIF
nr:hypothetical protein [Tanacetum cinerariifolium]